MNTLSAQKELRLLRNKDNNLNEKQCKALIKNYKKYMNGKISEINHPKTRHQIKNPSKIKVLYNNCINKYEISTSMSPISISKLTKFMSKKSKSLSKSSSKSSDLLKYEKYINIKGDDDIRDILYLPNITTFKSHRNLIRRLFSVPISVKKGIIVLKFADLTGPSGAKTGTKFPDRIALGAYPADIHPVTTCKMPAYAVEAHDTLPFYIPFRALTHRDLSNLLVAGKTMAQSFLANSATRLHPIEWSSGTACGIAAADMARTGRTSAALLGDIERLQERIKSSTPIDWTIPD